MVFECLCSCLHVRVVFKISRRFAIMFVSHPNELLE